MPVCAGTILIVEDDDQLRKVLRLTCESGGYRTLVAASGAEALKVGRRAELDVILLDVGLPDISGLEVCRQLRASGVHTPVIMISGLDELVDVVVGIEVGADDYVRKPFHVRELLARIGSQVRRRRSFAEPAEAIEIPGLLVDPASRRVLRDGEEVELTVMQFDLLYLLASRRGQVVSRDELARVGLDAERRTDSRSIDVQVHRLRRRLDRRGERSLIETVAGLGYRLSPPAAAARPRLHVVA